MIFDKNRVHDREDHEAAAHGRTFQQERGF